LFHAMPLVVILPLSYGLGIWTDCTGSHMLLLLLHAWYLHAAVSSNQQTHLGVKQETADLGWARHQMDLGVVYLDTDGVRRGPPPEPAGPDQG
jgi:hypothetical protein